MPEPIGILASLEYDQFFGHDCYDVGVMPCCTVIARVEYSNVAIVSEASDTE